MPKKKTVTKKSTVVSRETRKSVAPERIPVGGHRDKLVVKGLDPNYEYRWVVDTDDSGQRIFTFIEGGWEFEESHRVRVGQSFVYETSGGTSIIRRPAGGTQWNYLMRIKKEWYDEDQIEKQGLITDTEKQIARERDIEMDDGQYGGGRVRSTFDF